MVETDRAFPLVNIGRGGALVRSVVPLDVGTIHKMRLIVGEEATELDVEVRHVTRLAGSATPGYLLGVEFVRLSDEAERRVAALVGEESA